MTRPHFKIGDIVSDRIGKGWHGTIIGIESCPKFGPRAVIRVMAGNQHADFWYPFGWLKHVETSIAESPMDDTREYLQTVTGGQ